MTKYKRDNAKANQQKWSKDAEKRLNLKNKGNNSKRGKRC
jgi:hypothetical protein